jgi:hypothetical protein
VACIAGKRNIDFAFSRALPTLYNYEIQAAIDEFSPLNNWFTAQSHVLLAQTNELACKTNGFLWNRITACGGALAKDKTSPRKRGS